MRVEYHPLTVSDLNDAVVNYNQQRAGLGEEFRSDVYADIARIRANLSQYAVVEHDIRRCFVHRFPYSVLFRLINEEAIRILVIFERLRSGIQKPYSSCIEAGLAIITPLDDVLGDRRSRTPR